MPEEHMQQIPLDVRLLTFKKWNLPHTASICNVEDGYGEYISYQNYHFVDIQPVEETDTSRRFCAVYDQLETNRKAQAMKFPPMDLHTIQSMTLVGRSTDFWDACPNIVYISFIQLTNKRIDDLPALKKQILDVVRKDGDSDILKCALYESLDFCDLVLFTAGISLEKLQKCLWQLTLIRNQEKFQNIRDAFSFCCFRRQFLQHAFQNGTDAAGWNDTLSLSVDLSVQSLERWDILWHELKKICPIRVFKMLGRHDIRLTCTEISGNSVLQILGKLDALCCKGENGKVGLDRAFVSYHVTFFSEQLDGPVTGEQACVGTALYQTVNNAMTQWHRKQTSDAYEVARTYIEETFSALLTLSKSGFADEFVISVLPSLQSYIELLDELFETEENQKTFSSKIMYTPQIYFRALNTLALCTMHNERQFIQSPAFHATYFDIPPKLLAFYNALADDIVLAFSPQDEKIYRFILVPDYRDDIVVTPIEIETKQDPKNHLAVVSLHESLFYNPIKAIAVLCHEIAHHVGDRKREKRAEYIFQAVGIHLLKNTSHCTSEKVDCFGNSLLELLSQGFCVCLKEILDLRGRGILRGIPYILEGISDFLNEVDYGFMLIYDPEFSARLSRIWKTQLTENLAEPHSKVRTAFAQVMKKIDHTLHSKIASGEDGAVEYAVDIFIRSLVTELYYLKDSWEMGKTFTGVNFLTEYACSCQNIIQAFSETYADYRMLDILKGHISKDMYRQFLGVDDNTEDTQLLLRCRAIYRSKVLPQTDVKELPTFVNGGTEVYEFVVELLARYLAALSNDANDSSYMEELREIYNTFISKDELEQVSQIRSKILGYRRTLIANI